MRHTCIYVAHYGKVGCNTVFQYSFPVFLCFLWHGINNVTCILIKNLLFYLNSINRKMSIAQTAMITFVNLLNRKEELPGTWLRGLFLSQITIRMVSRFYHNLFTGDSLGCSLAPPRCSNGYRQILCWG